MRPMESIIIDPHKVKPSKHSIFLRFFYPPIKVDDVKHFFEKQCNGQCKVDFFSISQEQALAVAMRFDSAKVAASMMQKYHHEKILGCRVEVNWFRDIRKARRKVMENEGKYRSLLSKSSFRGRFNRPFRRGFDGRNSRFNGPSFRGRFNAYRRWQRSRSRSPVRHERSSRYHRRSPSDRSRRRSRSSSDSRASSYSTQSSTHSRKRSRDSMRDESRDRRGKSGSPVGDVNDGVASERTRDIKTASDNGSIAGSSPSRVTGPDGSSRDKGKLSRSPSTSRRNDEAGSDAEKSVANSENKTRRQAPYRRRSRSSTRSSSSSSSSSSGSTNKRHVASLTPDEIMLYQPDPIQVNDGEEMNEDSINIDTLGDKRYGRWLAEEPDEPVSEYVHAKISNGQSRNNSVGSVCENFRLDDVPLPSESPAAQSNQTIKITLQSPPLKMRSPLELIDEKEGRALAARRIPLPPPSSSSSSVTTKRRRFTDARPLSAEEGEIDDNEQTESVDSENSSVRQTELLPELHSAGVGYEDKQRHQKLAQQSPRVHVQTTSTGVQTSIELRPKLSVQNSTSCVSIQTAPVVNKQVAVQTEEEDMATRSEAFVNDMISRGQMTSDQVEKLIDMKRIIEATYRVDCKNYADATEKLARLNPDLEDRLTSSLGKLLETRAQASIKELREALLCKNS